MSKLAAAVSAVALLAVAALSGCTGDTSQPTESDGSHKAAVTTHQREVQGIIATRNSVTTFTGSYATYEISLDHNGNATMVRILPLKNTAIPGLDAVIKEGTLSVDLIGGNRKVTCSLKAQGCVIDKPMEWDYLSVGQPSSVAAAYHDTQSVWWNPTRRPVATDKLSNRRGNRSFVFKGQAASFVVEMDSRWRILSVVELNSDKNSRFNIDYKGHGTECFAGDVCSYVNSPKRFDKLVETHAGGIGRIMTLKQVKELPSYWD